MFTVEVSVNRNGKIEGIVSQEEQFTSDTRKITVLGKLIFKDLKSVESFRSAATRGGISVFLS